MIQSDAELRVTLERLGWFQEQVALLRRSEPNPANYRAASSGFLAIHPSDPALASTRSTTT